MRLLYSQNTDHYWCTTVWYCMCYTSSDERSRQICHVMSDHIYDVTVEVGNKKKTYWNAQPRKEENSSPAFLHCCASACKQTAECVWVGHSDKWMGDDGCVTTDGQTQTQTDLEIKKKNVKTGFKLNASQIITVRSFGPWAIEEI